MKKNVRIIIPMLIMLFGTILIFDFYSRVAEDQLIITTSTLEKEDGKIRHEAEVEIQWKWINYRVRKKGKNDLLVIETDERWDWDLKNASLKLRQDFKEDLRIKNLGLKNVHIFEIEDEGEDGGLNLTFAKDFPQVCFKDINLKVYYIHDSQSAFFPGQRSVNFVKELKSDVTYVKKNTLEELGEQDIQTMSYYTRKEQRPISIAIELAKELVKDLLQSSPVVVENMPEDLVFDRMLQMPDMETLFIDETGKYMKFEFGEALYEIHRPILYKMDHFIIENQEKEQPIILGYEKGLLLADEEQNIELIYTGDIELKLNKNKNILVASNLPKPKEVSLRELEGNEEKGVTEFLISFSTTSPEEHQEKRYYKVYKVQDEEISVLFDSEQEEKRENLISAQYIGDKKYRINLPVQNLFEIFTVPKELIWYSEDIIREKLSKESITIGEFLQIQFLDIQRDGKTELWMRRPIYISEHILLGYVNEFYYLRNGRYELAKTLIENPRSHNRKVIAVLLQNPKLTIDEIAKQGDLSPVTVRETLTHLILQGFIEREQKEVQTRKGKKLIDIYSIKA